MSKKNKKVYPERSRRVFVGMSGGVDSSVAAALLKRQGYEVIGVFIKIADFSEEWGIKCTWREERREAMRVAAHLDIPLVTIDLSKEYRERVVGYMIREYKAGRTPNPDVMCNREIKFGAFYQWAMSHGADYVATGHYVRLYNSSHLLWLKRRGRSLEYELPSPTLVTPLLSKRGAGGELLKAVDPAKDQSYFLWTLTPEQLQHSLFPIGEYQKAAVRKLAKKFGLPNADKKDSQGLCFIGHLAVKDFLKKFIPVKVGQVLNEKGQVIGEHQGAAFYTIGERHGFKITAKKPSDKPYYITAKDIKKNQLIVANRPLDTGCPRLGHPVSKLSQLNWLGGSAPDLSQTYQAQIRYHGELYPCRLKALDQQKNSVELKFLDQPRALTAGQSAVIYDGQVMLGGGVIDSSV